MLKRIKPISKFAPLVVGCCLLLSTSAIASTKAIDKCPPKGGSVEKQSDKWIVYSKSSVSSENYDSSRNYVCRADRGSQKPYLLPGNSSGSSEGGDSTSSTGLGSYLLNGDWLGATLSSSSDDPSGSTSEQTFMTFDLEKRTVDLERTVDTSSGGGFKATQLASDGVAAWIEQQKSDSSPKSLIVYDGSSIKHVIAYGDLDDKLELSGRTLTYYENSGAVKTTKTYELQPLTASQNTVCTPAGATTLAKSKRSKLIVYKQTITDIESSFGNSETFVVYRACTKNTKQKPLALTDYEPLYGPAYLNGKYLAYFDELQTVKVLKLASFAPLVVGSKKEYEEVEAGLNPYSIIVTKDGAVAWTEKPKGTSLVRVIDGRQRRHVVARGSGIKRDLKLNGQKLTYFKTVNGKKKAFTYTMRKLKPKKK